SSAGTCIVRVSGLGVEVGREDMVFLASVKCAAEFRIGEVALCMWRTFGFQRISHFLSPWTCSLATYSFHNPLPPDLPCLVDSVARRRRPSRLPNPPTSHILNPISKDPFPPPFP